MLGEEPPTLAADLFLIMLDDASGALRAHPRVAGYALAGALLVELWWTNAITVAGGAVTVAADQRLPGDALLRRTLGWLLADPEQTGVAGWVEALASTALELVAGQVEGHGWIRRVTRRRGGVRYEPVDRNRVFWRPSRLFVALGRQPTWPDVFLFALLDAAGVVPVLLASSAYPPSKQQITALSASLRQSYPEVVELLGVVRRFADRVAVAPR